MLLSILTEYDKYLVVSEVKGREVQGQIASPTGFNAISLEDLANQENVEIIYKNKRR